MVLNPQLASNAVDDPIPVQPECYSSSYQRCGHREEPRSGRNLRHGVNAPPLMLGVGGMVGLGRRMLGVAIVAPGVRVLAPRRDRHA